MLPKKRRVPLQSFPKNAKAVIRTKNFAAKVVPNNISSNRLGVIIGKTAGSATKRNKLRRLIMALFSEQSGFWGYEEGKGRDVVIVVYPGAANLPIKELKQELEKYGRIF